MSRMRLPPLVFPVLTALMIILLAPVVRAQDVCHDQVWGATEYCGHDAYAVTGETDMTHDCVVDFVDVALFYASWGASGPGLSGDFNGDGVVDLADVTFLAPSVGIPVSPCTPWPNIPDDCVGVLSLSLDQTAIVSRGRANPFTTVTVYVIADEWIDAAVLEFGLLTSSNLALNSSSSPAGWTEGMTQSSGNSHYTSWFGAPATGRTVVAAITFLVTDSSPAWVELVDYNASATMLNRWVPSTYDRKSEFRVRRHVAVNGPETASTTACPAVNAAPTVAIADPPGNIQVPYGTTSYVVSGTAADTDDGIAFVELRVNNGAWQTPSGTTSWSQSIPLVLGENWVQVRCADTVGAHSSTAVVSIVRQDQSDLEVTQWAAPDTVLAGCAVASVSATVTNSSATGDAPVSRLGFYLSSDAVIDASDHLIDTAAVPALAVGTSTTITVPLVLRDDGPRGAIFIGAFIDDVGTVDESNETNNTASRPLEFPVPAITDIADVGNDQGRVVRITVPASSRDALGSPTPILQYEFFRRIDPLPPVPIGSALPFQGEQISAPNKLGGWEFAGAVPAHGEAEYSALLPTLADSTTSGIHWSVFFVRAATAQPLVFFDSCADSGYSVDNLAPSVPTALFVAYAHDGNELTWEPCPDKDFRYFRIYRGPDDEFVPDPETLVKVTTGTDWLDPASNPWHHRYKVAAVDFAGNESAAAVPSGVSGTPDTPAIPQRFALHQCVPNPFNPLTRIRYELPQAAQVRLDVFSASGRLVATIVHAEQPPGSHEAVWEGRDTTGRVVAAGVYFYRLEAGSFVDTKRMVLVK